MSMVFPGGSFTQNFAPPQNRAAAQQQFGFRPASQTVTGDARGGFAGAPADKRPPPFEMGAAQTPWGPSYDPFNERMGIVQQQQMQNMQRQLMFNNTSFSQPQTWNQSPAFDMGFAQQQAGLAKGSPTWGGVNQPMTFGPSSQGSWQSPTGFQYGPPPQGQAQPIQPPSQGTPYGYGSTERGPVRSTPANSSPPTPVMYGQAQPMQSPSQGTPYGQMPRQPGQGDGAEPSRNRDGRVLKADPRREMESLQQKMVADSPHWQGRADAPSGSVWDHPQNSAVRDRIMKNIAEYDRDPYDSTGWMLDGQPMLPTPSPPQQANGGYYNAGGDKFRGSVSFAPGTSASDQDQAYGAYAAGRGYYPGQSANPYGPPPYMPYGGEQWAAATSPWGRQPTAPPTQAQPGRAQPIQPPSQGNPYAPYFPPGTAPPSRAPSPQAQPSQGTPSQNPAPTRADLLATARDSTKSREERLDALLKEINLEHPGAKGYSGKYENPERRQILKSIDAATPRRPLTREEQVSRDYNNMVIGRFHDQAKKGGPPRRTPDPPVHVNKRVGARDQRFKRVALKR